MNQPSGVGDRRNDGPASAVAPLLQASVYDVREMDPIDVQALGLRVLVMRVWPRGISWGEVDLWLPDAGPSLGLLQAYKRGEMDWGAFAERYKHEQLFEWRHAGYYKIGRGKAGLRISTMAPLQHLRALRMEHPVVTVMCVERPPDRCHRHVLMETADEVLVGDRVWHSGTESSGEVTSRDRDGHILVSMVGDALPRRYHVSEVQIL